MTTVVEMAQKIGPVFCVDARAKVPLEAGWQEQATCDPDQISQMNFSQGVAIKTGVSRNQNLVVIDVDTPEAQSYLNDHCGRRELETFVVKTPRGGCHYYFKGDLDKPLKCRVGMEISGLDVRASGGYAIAPPSEGYTISQDRPLLDLPVWLKWTIGVYSEASHQIAPEDLPDFTLSSKDQLWKLLRNIDPGLSREHWIKALSVAKYYFDDAYETALYWSALSEDKFPGESRFQQDWDSLARLEVKPSTLIYLAQECPWERSLLPVISSRDLGEAKGLSQSLLDKVVEELERNNQLTVREKEVLRISSEIMVFSLFSEDRSRIAFSLPTGFGKSTLIRSLIWLLQEHDLDHRLLVCVSRVQEIEENIESLRDMGITGETVGVYLSASYSTDWDCPGTECQSKKVLFITHARVHVSANYWDLQGLVEVDGRKRLVLWDESAQTMRGDWYDCDMIEDQIRGACHRFNRIVRSLNTEDEKFKQWLAKLRDQLDDERYGRFLVDCAWNPNGFEQRNFKLGKELKELVKVSHRYELAWTKSGHASSILIRNEILVPDELQCLIFDASSSIRSLIRLDQSIEHFVPKMERNYSRCCFYNVNLKSSKSHLAIQDNLDQQIRILRKWMTELSIEADQLLVMTKKGYNLHGEVDIKERLEGEFPGVHVETWGKERGVNKYRDISYTANIGMNWRDTKDLQANGIAQTRNLDTLMEYKEIGQIQRDEFLSEVQQWVARTRMRGSENGFALGTHVLFIHRYASALSVELQKRVFPGLSSELYCEDEEGPEQQKENMVQSLCVYLSDIQEQSSISSQVMKEYLRETYPESEYGKLTKSRWKAISGRLKDEVAFTWKRRNRSWVKV